MRLRLEERVREAILFTLMRVRDRYVAVRVTVAIDDLFGLVYQRRR
jgi:hypothetical protein